MPKPDAKSRAEARKQALMRGLDPLEVTKQMMMGRSAKAALTHEKGAAAEKSYLAARGQKQLTIHVSNELHTRLKIASAAQGQTMRQILTGLLEKAVPPLRNK